MATSARRPSADRRTPQAPPSSDPGQAELAGFPARIAARAVDMFTVLFLTLALVLIGLAPVMSAATARFDPEPWGLAFAATVLYALVAFVYEAVFLAVRGQTPGKDLCRVKVVVDGCIDGDALGWRRALVRTFPVIALRLVPGVTLGTVAVFVLGVTATFDARRRAIHDRLAGTLVVVATDDDDEFPPAPTLPRSYGPRWPWWSSRRDDDRP